MNQIPDTPEVRAARAEYDSRIRQYDLAREAMVAARDAFHAAVRAARADAKQESPQAVRNRSIAAERAAGATYAGLARKYGISPLRVKQITEKESRN